MITDIAHWGTGLAMGFVAGAGLCIPFIARVVLHNRNLAKANAGHSEALKNQQAHWDKIEQGYITAICTLWANLAKRNRNYTDIKENIFIMRALKRREQNAGELSP